MKNTRPVTENSDDDHHNMHTGKVGPVESTLTELRILLTGKTGNGKSSLGNALLGRRQFETGRSMSSTTTEMQCGDTADRDGTHFKVVDTPDPINNDMTDSQIRQEVSKWIAAMAPHPSIILLAIRCDVRYTKEEYEIYRKTIDLLGGNSVKGRLVVAFTFGDRQDRDIGEELKTVCPELKNVLKDAGGRYVVFNDNAADAQKEAFVKRVKQLAMETRDRSPRCDKGSSICLLLVILLGLVVVICILLAYAFDFKWEAVGLGVVGIVLGLVLLVVFFIVWKSRGAANSEQASCSHCSNVCFSLLPSRD